MGYTLGVDIGTFESKGVLVDNEGKIVSSAARPHELIVPQAGWAEHRAEEDWWGDLVSITREILKESKIPPGDIKAVATSAIGPCMLPLDETGRPLMNGVLYGVDTRSEREIEDLSAKIGEERILEVCGNALTTQSVGPKILWLKRNRPEIWARTSLIATSTTYLTYKLTGEYVIDHYTAANFSPIYDVNSLDWTDALDGDIAGRDMLPRLMWSGDVAGSVSAAASEETGLVEGTPVTCGTIDAAAEAISVGTRQKGDMMMMYGSTIFIIQITEGPVRDRRLWYAPWLTSGTHASMAGLATSGTLTHWFRDQFARELSREKAFEVLAKEAGGSPQGANGLLFLPYFSGERTPIHDPRAKGTFFGLNLTHNRGDLYRAVLEGIACGTAEVIETYRDVGNPPRRILAVGGGTKNELWLQATSDIGGVPQVVCEKTIGASFGDAFLAACAVGLADDGDIDGWNAVERRVEPQAHDAYSRQYPLFKELYKSTRRIAHALDG